MRYSRRFSKVVSAYFFIPLVVVALLVAGCGGSNGNTSNNSSSDKHGGTLTIIPTPVGDFTDNFNPYSSSVDRGSHGLIYEALLYINAVNGDTHPWLASSYAYSEGGKVLTFKLRTDVAWNDGQKFTSADVVYTFNMFKQYPATDPRGYGTTLTSVTAPDPSTVVFTFAHPNSAYLYYVGGQTWIVPEHIFSTIGDPTKFTDPNPVGTGPYMVDSFSPQVYSLKANPHFWIPGEPYVEHVRYPAVNANTSADLLLQSGDLDWAGVFTPNIKKWASSSPNNHYFWPPANITAFYVNLTKAPFNDVQVRKAINAAIDRNAIVQEAEHGLVDMASQTGLVLPNNSNFLAPEYANLKYGAVNPAQARSILDAAGYKKNAQGNYLNKDGSPIAFKIDVVTSFSDWVTSAQIIAANLNAIGFQVTLNSVAFGAYYSDLANGSFGGAMGWTNGGPTPYYILHDMLSSKQTAPIGQSAATNYWRWQDPKTDQLLAQYEGSSDFATQKSAIEGLEKIMVEQVPSFPLFEAPIYNAYSTARFTGWPTASNLYAAPAPYGDTDAEQILLKLRLV